MFHSMLYCDSYAEEHSVTQIARYQTTPREWLKSTHQYLQDGNCTLQSNTINCACCRLYDPYFSKGTSHILEPPLFFQRNLLPSHETPLLGKHPLGTSQLRVIGHHYLEFSGTRRFPNL